MNRSTTSIPVAIGVTTLVAILAWYFSSQGNGNGNKEVSRNAVGLRDKEGQLILETNKNQQPILETNENQQPKPYREPLRNRSDSGDYGSEEYPDIRDSFGGKKTKRKRRSRKTRSHSRKSRSHSRKSRK